MKGTGNREQGTVPASETPRTDAVWLETAKMDVGDAECRLRKHAEELEREVNEARERAEYFHLKVCVYAVEGHWKMPDDLPWKKREGGQS